MYPTLLEISSTIALLLVCIGTASALSKMLKLHPEGPRIENPKRERLQALYLVVVVFICTAFLEMVRFIFYRPFFHLDERPPFTIDHIDVFFALLFYFPWWASLFVIMRKSGQGLESIGVNKRNWMRVMTFGLLMALVYFSIVGFFASSFSSGYTPTVLSLVYSLFLNSVIGMSEELVWRGHIQTRIIANCGTLKGLACTSVLFGLLHFPQRFFLYSGAILEALSSTLLVTAAGLFFGYIMIKSQNILAPAIVYTIANWTSLFWGITSF